MVRSGEVGMPHDGIGAIEAMLQVLGGTCYVARHGNHCDQCTFQGLVLVQAAQCLNEQVYTLVFKLITSTVKDHQTIAVDGLATQSIDNMQNSLA